MKTKIIKKSWFVWFVSWAMVLSLILPMMPVKAAQSFTINGVTVSENSASGNCSDFASKIVNMIFTFKQGDVTTTFNNQYNILRNMSAEQRKVTAEHTKEFVRAVPLGAKIRICKSSDQSTNNYDNSKYGHTIVLVARDDEKGTFTTLEGGYGSNGKSSAMRVYTYKEFAQEWTSRKSYNYFFYVDDFSALYKKNGASGGSSGVQAQTTVPTVSFQGVSVPQVTCGKGQSITGKITSNVAITRIRAYVQNTNLDKTVKVNTSAYQLTGSEIDYALTFGTLLPGNYKLCFEVTAGQKTFTSSCVISVTFANEKITISGLRVPNTRVGYGSPLYGQIKSKGSPIQAVSCVIEGTDIRKDIYFSGNVYQYNINNSALDRGVTIGRIRRAGTYKLSILVILRDGSKKIETTLFNVR